MTTPESPDHPGPADKAGKPRKRGWLNWGDHPIVAVLAVLASVATILQLFKPEAKGTDQQLLSDLASSAKAPVVVETAKCTEAAGRWDWFPTGGVVVIARTGTMVWYQRASDRRPAITGTWECDLRNPRHYTFRWKETLLVDSMMLSTDFQRIAGANMSSGLRLSGTRAH